MDTFFRAALARNMALDEEKLGLDVKTWPIATGLIAKRAHSQSDYRVDVSIRMFKRTQAVLRKAIREFVWQD